MISSLSLSLSYLLCEDGVVDFAKLETREDSAGFQDTKGFGQDTVDVGAVTDAKSDRVEVLRIGFDSLEILGVSQSEGNLRTCCNVRDTKG
jgi:hypothetical protein